MLFVLAGRWPSRSEIKKMNVAELKKVIMDSTIAVVERDDYSDPVVNAQAESWKLLKRKLGVDQAEEWWYSFGEKKYPAGSKFSGPRGGFDTTPDGD